MTNMAGSTTGERGVPWRLIGWGGAACLLAVPAVAMRFTSEVDWGPEDFIVMGILFALVGGGVELVVRLSSSLACRAAAGVAILAAFLTIWVNLAVGMIGNEDNGYNLVFAGVLGIALLGAALAGFRREGAAWAMAAAGAAQLLAAAFGFPADPRGAIFSAFFALPWLLSAALFRYAARRS